jgi:RNA methyltransferase, TrmH family
VVGASALGHPEVAQLLDRYALKPVIVADGLFKSISTLHNGLGIAFAIDTPAPALPASIDRDAVYLDRVQDPGNVGTILRSCAAAGIATVLTAPGTAFCWSPKVLRAAMGAHFHLEIHESVSWSAVSERLEVEVVATRATDAVPIFEADLSSARIWLFGNEGEGLSAEPSASAHRWLCIPQEPGVESLNVAAAVAVCLFEQRRQRGMRR